MGKTVERVRISSNTVISEEEQLKRLKQLSGKKQIFPINRETFLNSIPTDWREDENDVEEFLSFLTEMKRR